MIPKDPILLLGYINMKLRDQYESLDALCDDLDVDKGEIIATLAAIDYQYDEARNQFK
jgi:hypothetical protein